MTFPIYELSECHRSAISKLSQNLITPHEFLSLYPDLDYGDLAEICHCSISTVSHWFTSGKTHTEPKPAHLLWLSLAHHALQRVEKERRQQFAI